MFFFRKEQETQGWGPLNGSHVSSKSFKASRTRQIKLLEGRGEKVYPVKGSLICPQAKPSFFPSGPFNIWLLATSLNRSQGDRDRWRYSLRRFMILAKGQEEVLKKGIVFFPKRLCYLVWMLVLLTTLYPWFISTLVCLYLQSRTKPLSLFSFATLVFTPLILTKCRGLRECFIIIQTLKVHFLWSKWHEYEFFGFVKSLGTIWVCSWLQLKDPFCVCFFLLSKPC